MSDSTSTLPVLIAGAGPSGLVLALTLLKNGVNVRIIDKDPHFHIGQRGAGIQPRTLEVYNLLGVLPDVYARGIPFMPMRFHKFAGGVEHIKTTYMVALEDPTPSTPYINAWMLGQNIAEEILRAHLAAYGCHVERGTELRTFEQHADRVVAHVTRKEGEGERDEKEEVVVCRWLAGADGARGVVRKQLGLTFVGESLSEHIFFGEIEVRGLDREHWHLWGSAQTKLIMLRPTETEGIYTFGLSGDMDYARIFADYDVLVQTLREGTGLKDLVFGEVHWKTNYKPNVRMVNKFSEGRVFVVGDAAHVHSPSGGQGLNSSVQDAFNLGWKLALVHKGLASPSLLATYTEERLPVIAHMLGLSTKFFRATRHGDTASDRPEQGWQRSREVKQLGINYRWSSIVRDERATPSVDEHGRQPSDVYGTEGGAVLRAGDRAPDAPGLVPVDGETGVEPTSLFRVFGPSYHTVLVFSSTPEQIDAVCDLLKTYPGGVVRSVIIVSKDGDNAPAVRGPDLVFYDRDGYAHTSYQVERGSTTIVAVRPDGVVGGIFVGLTGLAKYFEVIFSAVTV